jgi:hypothetical protein
MVVADAPQAGHDLIQTFDMTLRNPEQHQKTPR